MADLPVTAVAVEGKVRIMFSPLNFTDQQRADILELATADELLTGMLGIVQRDLTADEADDLTAAIAEAQMTAAAQRTAAADRAYLLGLGAESTRDMAEVLYGSAIPTDAALHAITYMGRHREPYPAYKGSGDPFYAASADAPDYQHPDDDDEASQ